ncbi:hypothetical protein [Glaciimonas soli]|uniref:Uncharacterized protein n=1 Tax=Glaciimonas soli TaxID=2590999 RepID=A0A843YXF5_9BURK|nr:hypothetical protein [Glaciimonas soli]MQR02354.1 hypothetical protein [Glaciimonas soli]
MHDGHDDKDHFFHSNLTSSYVLIKRDQHNNRYGALLCYNLSVGGAEKQEGIAVFLSPIDAHIEALSLNKDFNEWEVTPFHQACPREFIQTHDFKLTIYLVYAMAATNGKLVGFRDGGSYPSGLLKPYQFDVSLEVVKQECFTVVCNNLDAVDEIYGRSGIHNYYGTLLDIAEWSYSEKLAAAEHAVKLCEITSDTSDINQCGLYDPLEKKWVFVGDKETELLN